MSERCPVCGSPVRVSETVKIDVSSAGDEYRGTAIHTMRVQHRVCKACRLSGVQTHFISPVEWKDQSTGEIYR